jgi:hypothetical protein
VRRSHPLPCTGRVGVRKYLNCKHATDSHHYENPNKLKRDNCLQQKTALIMK